MHPKASLYSGKAFKKLKIRGNKSTWTCKGMGDQKVEVQKLKSGFALCQQLFRFLASTLNSYIS